MMEIRYKSRSWARCNNVYEKFDLWDLANLLWLSNISKERIAMRVMEFDRNVWNTSSLKKDSI